MASRTERPNDELEDMMTLVNEQYCGTRIPPVDNVPTLKMLQPEKPKRMFTI